MTTVSDIKKKLKGYKYVDKAANDIATMVTNFKSVKLQDIKQFAHPNGRRENCVSICGTIPVIIKGQTYNIPIIFWIHPKHPYESPIVYVLPTGSMTIKVSQFVDTSGRVHLPYLNFWKVSTSDLSALGQILCSTFADYCPVYAKLPVSPRMLSPQSSLNQFPETSAFPAASSHVTNRLHVAITDVGYISLKEKAPSNYIVIENTHDGKKGNFVEGRHNRYLCYCRRQISSESQGTMIVTDLMVLPMGERTPLGYFPVNNIRDDGVQVFKKKQLLVQLVAQEEAKEAVTEILLLRAHNKEEVKNGFKHLPEIGGLQICFKIATLGMSHLQHSLEKNFTSVSKESGSPSIAKSVQFMRPQSPAPGPPYHRSNSECEGIEELKQKNVQLCMELEAANKYVRELQAQLKSSQQSQDETGEGDDYEEVRYVNVQRTLLFGANDVLWKVRRNEVRITKEIGRGASGLVSKGLFHGQEVAVKQIHQSILSQPHVIDEFKREVRIMANIQHPNLVRFIGAVFDEAVENLTATPLLLLELLQTNLRRAYENSDLGQTVSLSIFRDVAYGLHYLHEHQKPIIHRDVSTPNVLLEALPGEMWRAKLSDFGSANFLKSSKTPGVGAIVYTAPEMFPRQDPTAPMPQPTVKCDVFSFGIVLVEVITRSMPSAENRHRLFQEVQRKWPAIHELTVQCTQAQPRDRPTMSSVLNTLYHVPTN